MEVIQYYLITFTSQDCDYSYNLIDTEYKDAMYFLYYYCEFCNGNNKFTDLYNEFGDKYNYYELLDSKIKNQKDNKKIINNYIYLQKSN